MFIFILKGVSVRKSLVLTSLVATAILFSGCATTELQTNAKMTQSVFINPVAKDKRTIFVSMKNTSGTNINLEQTITSALMAKGYMLVDDPDVATYVLMTNVLYCNKKSENNVANGVAMGGMTGAIANSGSGNFRSIGAAGLAGALVGGAIGKATEDTIFQMQVDIMIREKAKGKVTATKGNMAGQASIQDSQRAGFINALAGNIANTDASGQMNSNMVNSGSQTFESDYIEHKTMMFAEATKMGLALEEATPILEQKIAQQVAGLF